jgi:hypothetical protein
MNALQLCALLAATETDVLPGKWPEVQEGQQAILEDLRTVAPLPALQELADHVYWASAATECIDAGLVTGPRVHIKGADKIVAVARERGLSVPKASPGEVLFNRSAAAR